MSEHCLERVVQRFHPSDQNPRRCDDLCEFAVGIFRVLGDKLDGSIPDNSNLTDMRSLHQRHGQTAGIICVETHAVRVSIPQLPEKSFDPAKPEKPAVGQNPDQIGQRLDLVKDMG